MRDLLVKLQCRMKHKIALRSGLFVSTVFDGQQRRCREKRCEICRKPFVLPVGRQQTTCSTVCKGVSQRTRTSRKCPVCDNAFDIRPSHLKIIRGIPCCSRACRNKGQRLDSNVDVSRPASWGTAVGRTEAARLRREIVRKALGRVSCGMRFKGVLTLHHIDGDETNNQSSNLEVVCFLHHGTRHMFFKGGEWVYKTSCLTPRSRLREVEVLVERSRPKKNSTRG